ncbi:hypothetical protein CS542_02490 [Pedobacter sp. IW39]|nr:hypothetical protein CS542_02490 [Pedobacter sp. IW39]
MKQLKQYGLKSYHRYRISCWRCNYPFGEDNFTSSVIESFKIEAYSPDSSAVVVKMNKVLMEQKSFNDVFNDRA